MFSLRGWGPYSETNIELLGSEATYGPHGRRRDNREVVIKLAVRHPNKQALVLFSREIAQAATGMAPGLTGIVGGRPTVYPVIRLFSFLIEKAPAPCTLIWRVNVILAPCPHWSRSTAKICRLPSNRRNLRVAPMPVWRW